MADGPPLQSDPVPQAGEVEAEVAALSLGEKAAEPANAQENVRGVVEKGVLEAPITTKNWKVADGSKVEQNKWFPLGGGSFDVRTGPDYKKNKKKSPSQLPMYECARVHRIKSAKKAPHFGSTVTMPPEAEAFRGLALPGVIVCNWMVRQPPTFPSLSCLPSFVCRAAELQHHYYRRLRRHHCMYAN